MEAFLQIVFSGLTLGAMYALSAVGLTLLWGVVGMLNMSQGVMLAIGGYASYSAITYLGLPWPLGLPAAIIGGVHHGPGFLPRDGALDVPGSGIRGEHHHRHRRGPPSSLRA